MNQCVDTMQSRYYGALILVFIATGLVTALLVVIPFFAAAQRVDGAIKPEIYYRSPYPHYRCVPVNPDEMRCRRCGTIDMNTVNCTTCTVDRTTGDFYDCFVTVGDVTEIPSVLDMVASSVEVTQPPTPVPVPVPVPVPAPQSLPSPSADVPVPSAEEIVPSADPVPEAPLAE